MAEEEEEEEENPAEEATTEETTPNFFPLDKWLVVTYDGEKFPGENTSRDTADIEVNVMQ